MIDLEQRLATLELQTAALEQRLVKMSQEVQAGRVVASSMAYLLGILATRSGINPDELNMMINDGQFEALLKESKR